MQTIIKLKKEKNPEIPTTKKHKKELFCPCHIGSKDFILFWPQQYRTPTDAQRSDDVAGDLFLFTVEPPYKTSKHVRKSGLIKEEVLQ